MTTTRSKFRGVVSLWTKTSQFRILRSHLVIHTLAVALARSAFAELQFVTDHKGAAIARVLGWEFDDVNLTLESFEAEGLEHVWALGKLVAMTLQEGPAIQFDGDVLLFKKLPDRFVRAKLIAQSPDRDDYYCGNDMSRAFKQAHIPEGFRKYNAGLIGGVDHHLVRAWAHYAIDLANRFRFFNLNGTATSMVIEQASFGYFSARCGYPVKTLLSELPSREEVEEVGYAHLVGAAKRNPYYVERAELRLQRDFPHQWEKFLAGWALIEQCAGDLSNLISSYEPR